MLEFPFGIYNFKIKSYDTDQNGNLTLPTILHFLQECAWNNARANGFGYEDLEKENVFWVLSKIFIEIDEYPKWKDDIKIKTWPKGTDGLFAIRDFQIIKNDVIIARATSYWLILDQKNNRPKRLEHFNFIHENFLKDDAVKKKLGKVSFSSDIAELDIRKVYYSDLDVNRHVNNATYVRWILDSYFSTENKNITELEINFLTELKLNDEFVVNYLCKDGIHYYVLKNKSNKDICKVKLK